MQLWAVTWQYGGKHYLVDHDDSVTAVEHAGLLAERGRDEIVVTMHEWEVPEDVRRRVLERIQARIAAEEGSRLLEMMG